MQDPIRSQAGTPESNHSFIAENQKELTAAGQAVAFAALKQSDVVFRQLFEESADAILLIENDRFVDCNGAAVTMMRCRSKDELLSLHPSQLSPEFQPSGRSSFEKANEIFASMAHQRNHRFEWMYRRVDGEDFWVEVLLTQLEINGRQIFHTTWREIGDRKTTEAELQVQKHFLRSVYEAVEHSITVVDVLEDGEFRFVGWNPATEKITGMLNEAIVGKTPEEVMGQEHGAIVRQDYHRCLEAGTPITYEEYLPFNGCDFWWLTTLNPLKDDRGRIDRIVITSLDITEQKQAELALQQKAQREKLLNRMISQVRYSLNFDTILTTAVEEVLKVMQVDSCTFAWYCPDADNPYWEIVECFTDRERQNDRQQPNLLGRYPAAALGSLAQQLLALNAVAIDDTNQVRDVAVRQLFAELGYAASLNLPMQNASGLIGVLSCHHRTVRCWTDDEVKLLQAIMEQLTIALNQAELYAQSQTKAQELEQALQELQRTQIQMIQSEKMSSLGQLVAGVAHEINNPVNFIYGNVSPAEQYMQDLLRLIDLYQTHYPNPLSVIQDEIEAIDLEFMAKDLPRLLSSMKMGAERIRQIVKSLRTFSRLDEAEYKPVDIHEGIDSTLVILENRLKAQPDRPGIQVIKQYGKLPLVECYAGQLNQVFMNILTNALDALEERDQTRSPEDIMQTPSRVTIHTEQINADRIAIRIADNGPGIPEAVKSRIFDPFFTTKPIGKGTGMGMSISYQIITENHGGTLQCVSSPHQGAEFIIEMPLKQT